MKIAVSILVTSFAGVALMSMVGCETNTVQVVDSKTGAPIGGAEVYTKTGNLRTGSAYTDYSGATDEPEHPYDGSDLVVKKRGYRSVDFER